MTKTIAELDLIETIASLRDQKLEIERRIAESIGERRRLSRQRDAVRRRQSDEALAEAKKVHDKREQELSHAEDSLSALEARLDTGDASVSTEDLLMAEKAVERAKRLLTAAKGTLAEAERQARIDRCDSMIADRVAEILDANLDRLGLAGFDVEARHRPGREVPPSGRQVAVCQQEPTNGIGTLSPSGQVVVVVYAPADDLPTITGMSDLLTEYGCTVRLAEAGKPEPLEDPTYVRQMHVLSGDISHEIPHLFGGDRDELSLWCERVIGYWVDLVEHVRDGNGEIYKRTGSEGRGEIVSAEIENDPEAGTITSRAVLTLVTTEGDLPLDSINHRVHQIVDDMWLNDPTLIGRVKSIDVEAVEPTDVPYLDESWNGVEKVYTEQSARDAYEYAWKVNVTISGEYVPLDGAA